MTVRFHPEARDEFEQALRWYEERSPISAVAFASEIEVAVARIAKAPLSYPVAEPGTRRLVLDRFPYNLFYEIGSDDIVLIAVAHQKRRPAYWRDR